MDDWICYGAEVKLKNISFMQLVLGTTGALLIYAGLKDIDLILFFHHLVTDPSTAFQGTYDYKTNHKDTTKPSTSGTPSSDPTTPATPATPATPGTPNTNPWQSV